jgi:hypothetical protein
MPNLSANDLKTKGVSAIEAVLAHQPEVVFLFAVRSGSWLWTSSITII